MQFTTILAAIAAASLARAQDANPSLADALSSTQELSSLSTLLGDYPDLLAMLANATDITILAPSNSALESANMDLMSLSGIDGAVQALLSYHVLNGTVSSENITTTPTFARTLLANETYSNVTGGQVVGVRMVEEDGDNMGGVVILSGLGETSMVTVADIAVSNGIVHIIDTVLTIPGPVSFTALAAGLTAVAGALEATNLTSTIDGASDITVFAPTNSAFEDIGSALATLTAEQATAILGYHVVNGTVAYSSLLSNTSVTSMTGQPLNISITDGEVFVNSARVITADILVSGGVVHVIDSVLNPNSTMAPNPDESDGVPVYPGASSGAVPYTSGIPTPTTTYAGLASTTDAVAEGYTPASSGALESASSSVAEQPSSTGAAAAVTGAVGAAALFGGAAWLVNL